MLGNKIETKRKDSEPPVDPKFSAFMPKDRVPGYDLARALALLGMVFINYWVLVEDPNACPEWLDAVMNFIQGRAAATFVVLAGVGLSLLSRRAYLVKDAAGIAADRYVLWRRASFLFTIGLLYSMIWPADILHFYGIYLAIGAFLLTAPNRRLWALAIVISVAFSLFMIITDFDPGEAWGSIDYRDFFNLPRLSRHLFLDGCYPVFPWVAFMFMGIWLGRKNLSDHSVRNKLLMAGSGALVFSEFVSKITFRLISSAGIGFDLEKVLPLFAIDPWEPMPLFMLSSGGTALLVIGLSIILAEKFSRAKWLRPFLAVGQSTLTLYIAHIMVGNIFIEVMKRHDSYLSLFPVWGVIAFYTSALAFCLFWKRRFQKGPLEWLMRQFPFFSMPSKAKQGMQPRAV